MTNEVLSAVILLTLVVDPFGNVTLLAFMFGGKWFLEVMHLSETSLSIAGGVILFMIAIEMLLGGIRAFMKGLPA